MDCFLKVASLCCLWTKIIVSQYKFTSVWTRFPPKSSSFSSCLSFSLSRRSCLSISLCILSLSSSSADKQHESIAVQVYRLLFVSLCHSWQGLVKWMGADFVTPVGWLLVSFLALILPRVGSSSGAFHTLAETQSPEFLPSGPNAHKQLIFIWFYCLIGTQTRLRPARFLKTSGNKSFDQLLFTMNDYHPH